MNISCWNFRGKTLNVISQIKRNCKISWKRCSRIYDYKWRGSSFEQRLAGWTDFCHSPHLLRPLWSVLLSSVSAELLQQCPVWFSYLCCLYTCSQFLYSGHSMGKTKKRLCCFLFKLRLFILSFRVVKAEGLSPLNVFLLLGAHLHLFTCMCSLWPCIVSSGTVLFRILAPPFPSDVCLAYSIIFEGLLWSRCFKI